MKKHIEKLNWERELYSLLYEEYGDVGQNGNISKFIKNLILEREKELWQKMEKMKKTNIIATDRTEFELQMMIEVNNATLNDCQSLLDIDEK